MVNKKDLFISIIRIEDELYFIHDELNEIDKRLKKIEKGKKDVKVSK